MSLDTMNLENGTELYLPLSCLPPSPFITTIHPYVPNTNSPHHPPSTASTSANLFPQFLARCRHRGTYETETEAQYRHHPYLGPQPPTQLILHGLYSSIFPFFLTFLTCYSIQVLISESRVERMKG